MNLWIINCTKQNHIINLRHSEQTKLTPHRINMGSQKCVLENASKIEIEAILNQLRHYRLINISNVDSDREITGLCYSINKPVEAEKIYGAIETNGDRLDEQASKIQEYSALAANEFIEKTLGEIGATVKETGIEIEKIESDVNNKKGKTRKVEIKRSA